MTSILRRAQQGHVHNFSCFHAAVLILAALTFLSSPVTVARQPLGDPGLSMAVTFCQAGVEKPFLRSLASPQMPYCSLVTIFGDVGSCDLSDVPMAPLASQVWISVTTLRMALLAKEQSSVNNILSLSSLIYRKLP